MPSPPSWQPPVASEPRLRNDEARLTETLRQHFSMVWRAMRRFGVAEDAADDATQEVFIIAARKLDGVEPGRERPYLYGIALRVAANVRRALRNARECADDELLSAAAAETPTTDLLLEEKQLREMLDQILDKMPEELRTAFVLFEFEGFSEREVAELCAIPPGTAASRVRRSRELFRDAALRLKHRLSEGEPR